MSNATATAAPTFLVIGDRCWGRGSTPAAAVKRARKEGGAQSVKSYMVFLVDPEATVNDMGDISFPPDGRQPVQLYCVVGGQQFPVDQLVRSQDRLL